MQSLFQTFSAIARLIVRAAATVVLPALVILPQSHAQQGEQTFQPAQYQIEGVLAYCGDIQTIVRPQSEPLIFAPDGFRIIINGPAFNDLPRGVRLFLYYHTCGTIFYGDDLALADSFAVRSGARGQWLLAADLEFICQTDNLVGAGWHFAPDSARCENIVDLMIEALDRQ